MTIKEIELLEKAVNIILRNEKTLLTFEKLVSAHVRRKQKVILKSKPKHESYNMMKSTSSIH